jgi:hypothetical protein
VRTLVPNVVRAMHLHAGHRMKTAPMTVRVWSLNTEYAWLVEQEKGQHPTRR